MNGGWVNKMRKKHYDSVNAAVIEKKKSLLAVSIGSAAWGGIAPMERRASQCLRSHKQVGTPDADCGNVKNEGQWRHNAGIASCPPPNQYFKQTPPARPVSCMSELTHGNTVKPAKAEVMGVGSNLLIVFALAALCGCATYQPSPQAKEQIRRIQDAVPLAISLSLDDVSLGTMTAWENRVLYFKVVAVVVDIEGESKNPTAAHLASEIHDIRVLGRVPQAEAVALRCADLFIEQPALSDSRAILQELAWRIREQLPTRPVWAAPKRKAI